LCTLAAFGAAVVERFSVVDVVYNNAGLTVVKSIEDTSVDDWDRLHAVNVRAAAFLVKAVLPGLCRSSAAGRTMRKHFAQPEQVAAVAVYLATPEAAYINAAAIPVDDGMTAM
jgi:NAD(P)-dependent dehydrogenase (short-subunit alcohol dehydrogenase family)